MMTITKKQFQNLILIQIFVLITSVVAGFFTTRLLPVELQTFVNSSYEQDLGMWDMVMVSLSLPFLAWAIYNLRALYTFKPHAPKHFLYLTIVSMVFYLNIYEPFVFTNIDALLSDVLSLLSGFTLALVYFSNIALEFKTPVDAVEVAASQPSA